MNTHKKKEVVVVVVVEWMTWRGQSVGDDWGEWVIWNDSQQLKESDIDTKVREEEKGRTCSPAFKP